IDVSRTRIPEPPAGGVGAGSSGAAAGTAEEGHRKRAQHARDAARAQGAGGESGSARAPLQVLVLGGGLIGGALCDALARRGHSLFLATRSGTRRAGVDALALDFNALPDGNALAGALAGIDVLVNTVGIFRATAQQSFDAVHVKGPQALFGAARMAGVQRVVQLSALGADAGSSLPYFASKGRAEEALRQTGIGHAIVRPSLVFSPQGQSTRWFARLASLPLLPLPDGGTQQIQPVHLQDLVDALVRLVDAPEVPAALDAVGPQPLMLRDDLSLFRHAMGAVGWTVPVPVALPRAGARAGAAVSPQLPVDPDALSMLDAGNTADPMPMHRWLGRQARSPASFITPDSAAAMRGPALLGWTVPLMRWTLAFMWVATGIISLWLYPRELSMQMLGRVGLRGGLAEAALWSAALLDFALGAALLLVSRWRTQVYLAQLALVLGYTIIISLWLPEQWLHPFGPVLKNVPLLAMILSLLALDRRPWT